VEGEEERRREEKEERKRPHARCPRRRANAEADDDEDEEGVADLRSSTTYTPELWENTNSGYKRIELRTDEEILAIAARMKYA
jgi:hypothetical protein